MSVPASSERFLARAREVAADEVMLDLEDSVAPAAKDAYERATTAQQRGAIMFGEEMIDEASRKMALALVAKGAAAGLPRPADR